MAEVITKYINNIGNKIVLLVMKEFKFKNSTWIPNPILFLQTNVTGYLIKS